MTTAKHDTADQLARAHLTGYLEGENYYPPRATQGGNAGAKAIPRATAMVVAVRDEGPVEVAAILDPLNRDQLYALTVALAAMVPDDQPIDELLGWVADLGRNIELANERAGYARRRAAKVAA